MNLRKLPPSMLLTLGLACGDGKSSDETTVSACLSPPSSETDTGPCLSTTGVGPCLGAEPVTTTGEPSSTGTDTGGVDSTFGPCLSPEPPTGTGTDTGSGSGTDTGSGSGTDTEGTTGMLHDAPSSSRAAALERVLERGTLPADVAARLRARRQP